MTKNLKGAKTILSFWMLSNCFIKCLDVSQNSLLENVMILNCNIESNVAVLETRYFINIVVVNRDINCCDSKKRHVLNVKVLNHNIIEILCFWTAISSNCAISPKYFYHLLFQHLIIFWELVAQFIQRLTSI
jgi:hypothetical protein